MGRGRPRPLAEKDRQFLPPAQQEPGIDTLPGSGVVGTLLRWSKARPESFLAERHFIGARVLRLTGVSHLDRGDNCTEALRETITELLLMSEPHKRYTAMMSGLDVHYELRDNTDGSRGPVANPA